MPDVRMGVAGVNNRITTGTLDYVPWSGFAPTTDLIAGGLFFHSNALTYGTTASHAKLGIGGFDSDGNEWAVNAINRDTGTTIICDSVAADDAVMIQIHNSNGSIVGEAAMDATNPIITDGVRVNVSNAWSDTQESFAAIYAGKDMRCRAGNATSSASVGGTTTISSLPFAPKAVVCISAGTAFSSTPTSSIDLALFCGFAALEGAAIKQGGWNIWLQDGDDVTIGGAFMGGVSSDSYIMEPLNQHLGSIVTDGAIEVTDFGSDSVEFTTRLDAVAHEFGYLILGGADFHYYRKDNPTSPGTQATTGSGFRPGSMLQISNRHTGAPDTIATGQAVSCFGFGAFGPSSGQEGSVAINCDQNSNPHDAESHVNDEGLYTPNDGAGDWNHATINDGTGSWDSDGRTLNYTNTLAAAMKQHFLEMEEDTPEMVAVDLRSDLDTADQDCTRDGVATEVRADVGAATADMALAAVAVELRSDADAAGLDAALALVARDLRSESDTADQDKTQDMVAAELRSDLTQATQDVNQGMVGVDARAAFTAATMVVTRDMLARDVRSGLASATVTVASSMVARDLRASVSTASLDRTADLLAQDLRRSVALATQDITRNLFATELRSSFSIAFLTGAGEQLSIIFDVRTSSTAELGIVDTATTVLDAATSAIAELGIIDTATGVLDAITSALAELGIVDTATITLDVPTTATAEVRVVDAETGTLTAATSATAEAPIDDSDTVTEDARESQTGELS